MNYSVELAKGTDAGRVRRLNEDCVAIDPARGVFVLADGMGGHNAGEIASAMAVNFLLDALAGLHDQLHQRRHGDIAPVQLGLHDAVTRCNAQIFQAGRRDARYKGMGTTVVAGLLLEQQLHYVHVGDSRLYRLRDGVLRQLTQDHSLVQEMIQQSGQSEEEVMAAIPGNIVTRALGAEAEVEPAVGSDGLQAGDLYLCCSDGLSDRLTDEAIRTTLVGCEGLPAAVEHLIMQANEAGGEDNISLVLLRIKPASLLTRIRGYFP
ncbi:protein phosphatase 2C domain-containing protein [Sedimenticola thiotaurini]|uniref:PPM-type phosphatase domain-containing protein n=1 Tax=Sedimenticola thiotaurini TaxID=1543721 RepID=A0A0F7K0P8_9GAMM|nr:PP2C family serine/threonine-protein phosphatase [Sedimenticola thiotaurini]AKH20735.1 hypothetical protein AAY24_10660 [Sedimenticola thiotaurini]